MKLILKFILLLGILFPFSSHSQVVNLSLTHGGVNRTAIIYLPSGYTPTSSLPLVFNLHGYTSTANQQMNYSGMNTVAENNNFIVVYPNGINNQWNSGWVAPYNSSPNDVDFISTLIDTLHNLYQIDLQRVYSCGLSNGGFQSYRLACDLDDRIAAVASVGGFTTQLTAANCSNTRTVPSLLIHGTHDAVVPPNGTLGSLNLQETLDFWANRNSCDAAPVVYGISNSNVTDQSTVTKYVYDHCADQSENWYYEIQNGGHTWPGAIDVPSLGVTNKDINASEVIWEFFSHHTLSGGLLNLENKESDLEWSVYPSPAASQFTISSEKIQGEFDIRILDLQGRLIWKDKISVNEVYELPLKIPHGMYILNIWVENKLYTKKTILGFNK